MIPELVTVPGAAFSVLPPGVHFATLTEVETRFAITDHRRWLFEGILAVAEALRFANCAAMYLDGSYVSGKPHPNDFDGCWDPTGVDGSKLNPVLRDFSNRRENQKKRFRGEMFISSQTNGLDGTYFDFFQTEKDTGLRKGIIGIRLYNAVELN
jgi:hypothetical protein